MKKRGDRSHTRGARGREPPYGPFSRCSSSWCRSPLGYEPYDVHLCRLVRSPVPAVTSVNRWARLLQGLGVSPISPQSGASRAQIRAQIWFMTSGFLLFVVSGDGDLLLFRPDISPVGTDPARAMHFSPRFAVTGQLAGVRCVPLASGEGYESLT